MSQEQHKTSRAGFQLTQISAALSSLIVWTGEHRGERTGRGISVELNCNSDNQPLFWLEISVFLGGHTAWRKCLWGYNLTDFFLGGSAQTLIFVVLRKAIYICKSRFPTCTCQSFICGIMFLKAWQMVHSVPVFILFTYKSLQSLLDCCWLLFWGKMSLTFALWNLLYSHIQSMLHLLKA